MDQKPASAELTANQLRALAAEGNVLVVAGAGTGKTRTLVERCLARVLRGQDPVSIDQILMVTFTEAAAAEMRKRIREGLEERLARQPDNPWLAEQLGLLDTARISTLHSLCFELVREHFYDLRLDPQLTLLDEAQAHLLAIEVIKEMLQRHYAGQTPNAPAIGQLILVLGGGWDEPIRRLVFKLHHYTQTLADPECWLDEQLRACAEPDLARWEGWLADYFQTFRDQWLPVLRPQRQEKLQRCVAALEEVPPAPARAQVERALAAIHDTDRDWPRGTVGEFRQPNLDFFEEIEFLQSLSRPAPNWAQTAGGAAAPGNDPLLEDWQWLRPHLTALLELTREFGQRFAEAKRDQGAVDFHDLEQFALTLLWDRQANRPTPLAERWRQRVRLLFVDEYQDINAAQDTILQALAREGPAANRFMVGDVKQSIYRFRLANPHIFQRYREAWAGQAHVGRVIPLTENFRSHEAIVNFVNRVFERLLRRDVGGVAYGEAERLVFGAAQLRSALSVAADPSPRVELHLCVTGAEPEANDVQDAPSPPPGPNLAELTDAEREARLIARRLRELRQQGFQVRDQHGGNPRPVEWRDMVVLLRSRHNKAEIYAKEFERLGVPLQTTRGGFYEAIEVADLISLLMLLDNPMQDMPLLTVLRSPMVGLAVDELATIRLAQRPGRFWLALQRFHQRGSRAQVEALASATASAWQKVDDFLRGFTRWRRLTRQASLAQCLATVLEETHYEDWLLAQPRGGQRCANVERLLTLTRQFDRLQRQGLFRFLNFVEAQQEAGIDVEPAPLPTSDAVRLMSIHQSKGLEFPVVAVADLGKPFNLLDLRGAVILDEHYGLCAQVAPPQTEQRYPSLTYWLAQRRQRRETLGEELRLLYVAMTRAEQKLILAGTARGKDLTAKWVPAREQGLGFRQLLGARSYLDWLGPCLAHATGHTDWTINGRSPWLEWTIYQREDTRLAAPDQGPELQQELSPDRFAHSDAKLAALRDKLMWRYPCAEATREPAKASVSALRRRAIELADEEAWPVSFVRPTMAGSPGTLRDKLLSPSRLRAMRGKTELSAAETGTAHHLFQQFVDLARVDSPAALREEARRLELAGILSTAERDCLDVAALHAFWSSEWAIRLRANPEEVQRELPFTARFTLSELVELGVANLGDAAADEFVVVQGVVDLAVLRPSEIWLVDFKTDQLAATELSDKVAQYAPQLRLYALALERIYRRPVTEQCLYFLALGQAVRLDASADVAS